MAATKRDRVAAVAADSGRATTLALRPKSADDRINFLAQLCRLDTLLLASVAAAVSRCCCTSVSRLMAFDGAKT